MELTDNEKRVLLAHASSSVSRAKQHVFDIECSIIALKIRLDAALDAQKIAEKNYESAVKILEE